MKRNYLWIAAILLVAGTVFAQARTSYDVSEERVDISKLDRYYTSHTAQRRTFTNKHEYKRHKRRIAKRIERHPPRYHPSRYHRGENYRNDPYARPDREVRHFQRAYRYPKRGWVLAYRYDRAAFYDREGFYYGYFNRYGYFFDGIFYRYDYYYTYRDRVRGRGLFDRYFYRPAKWRYYGFCR